MLLQEPEEQRHHEDQLGPDIGAVPATRAIACQAAGDYWRFEAARARVVILSPRAHHREGARMEFETIVAKTEGALGHSS